MKLSDITENTSLIKDFKQRLAKSLGESVVATIIGKVKRTSGISAVPVDFNLENGQQVTTYLRVIDDKPDMYRIDINGKQMPTTGDFSNEYKPSFNKSVDEVAKFVKTGQTAFDAKIAKQKVKSPIAKNPNLSITKKIEQFSQQAGELDHQIELKTAEKQGLENRLAELEGR